MNVYTNAPIQYENKQIIDTLYSCIGAWKPTLLEGNICFASNLNINNDKLEEKLNGMTPDTKSSKYYSFWSNH